MERANEIDAFNAVLARLRSPHRIAPGTLMGPDIALMFSLILDRIVVLEQDMEMEKERKR